VRVISRPADPFRDPTQIPDDPADIRVQLISPWVCNDPAAFLRAEDDVIVEAEVG
jgi:hypothetical protein